MSTKCKCNGYDLSFRLKHHPFHPYFWKYLDHCWCNMTYTLIKHKITKCLNNWPAQATMFHKFYI